MILLRSRLLLDRLSYLLDELASRATVWLLLGAIIDEAPCSKTLDLTREHGGISRRSSGVFVAALVVHALSDRNNLSRHLLLKVGHHVVFAWFIGLEESWAFRHIVTTHLHESWRTLYRVKLGFIRRNTRTVSPFSAWQVVLSRVRALQSLILFP